MRALSIAVCDTVDGPLLIQKRSGDIQFKSWCQHIFRRIFAASHHDHIVLFIRIVIIINWNHPCNKWAQICAWHFVSHHNTYLEAVKNSVAWKPNNISSSSIAQLWSIKLYIYTCTSYCWLGYDCDKDNHSWNLLPLRLFTSVMPACMTEI